MISPDIGHLNSCDYEQVYEPAEDTFLLADILEADAAQLRTLRPKICVEIGSGSGYLSALVGLILNGYTPTPVYLCTDRNQSAAQATTRTGRRNRVLLNSVQTDFCQGLMDRLRGSVDLLIFNPPYVVTPSEEIRSTDPLAWSWAGGKDGREVLDRFFDHSIANLLLSPRGIFYLVLIASNRPQEVIEIFRQRWNIIGHVLGERKVGIEHLFIIKFQRNI